MDLPYDHVWVFNGEQGHPPSGVFTDLEAARDWIERHRLSGMLTAYASYRGVCDLVVQRGLWKPKEPHPSSPRFVGRFSSAFLDHLHLEDGEETGQPDQD